MIVVYAGRRTLADEGHTAERIADLFTELRPRLVIGSAAAGTDLLILERAGRREVPAQVVVYESVAEYAERSVADKGADWSARFQAALTRPGVTVHTVSAPEGEAEYRAVNARILEAAAAAAAPGENVVALVLRGPARAGPDFTAEFAAGAHERGWKVIDLDAGKRGPS
jgi:hypothetical protein